MNRLHRGGCLQPGYWGGWQWTYEDDRTAYVNLGGTSAGLRLSYRVRMAGEDQECIDDAVPLTWSSCTKGESRPCFVCPGMRNGKHCARRVAKLKRILELEDAADAAFALWFQRTFPDASLDDLSG